MASNNVMPLLTNEVSYPAVKKQDQWKPAKALRVTKVVNVIINLRPSRQGV